MQLKGLSITEGALEKCRAGFGFDSDFMMSRPMSKRLRGAAVRGHGQTETKEITIIEKPGRNSQRSWKSSIMKLPGVPPHSMPRLRATVVIDMTRWELHDDFPGFCGAVASQFFGALLEIAAVDDLQH